MSAIGRKQIFECSMPIQEICSCKARAMRALFLVKYAYGAYQAIASSYQI